MGGKRDPSQPRPVIICMPACAHARERDVRSTTGPPTPTVTCDRGTTGGTTAFHVITFTVTFSAAVSGFDVNDVTVVTPGGAAAYTGVFAVVGGAEPATQYTLQVTLVSAVASSVTVSVPEAGSGVSPVNLPAPAFLVNYGVCVV